jgi:hypothetical protein
MATPFSQGIETSHERRVEQLKKECSNEGAELINVENISLHEVNSVKASVGSTITSLVGGKAGYDFLQIYMIRQNNRIQYYFQPFSGLTALPGQHFLVIPGSIKNPIQYRIKKQQSFTESLYQTYINRLPFFVGKNIRVCEWLCVDSTEQLKLKGLKLPFLKEISHVWQNGLTKIELEWTFQANAINHEYSLVSMQTGRYGSLGERVGLKQFKQICSFVSQFGEHYIGDGSNNVMISNSYLGSLFRTKFLLDEQENRNNNVPVWNPKHIVRSIITNLLKFERYKKVYLVQDLDDKRRKNLKECVLSKNNIDPSQVIAAAAMDMFGNMKGAAVFMKDKLHISDTDYEHTIQLSEVQACNGLKGFTDSSMELILSDGEITKIQVGLMGEFLNKFFEEYCRI